MGSQITFILLLLFLSAFFSASETAFTSLSFLQIRSLETSKNRFDKLAAKLAQKPDVLLTTILIGNNIVNISASAIVTSAVIQKWGSNAIGIATGILTLAILIFGEITPKHLAISYNMVFVRISAAPIKGLSTLLYPVIGIIRFISSLITRLFTKETGKTLSLESLMHVVDVAENEGIVDEYETSLFQRVLHLNESPVKSIMTHRTEVFSLPVTMKVEEAYPQIISSGYSRIPVYQESLENIVGIVLLRDLLNTDMGKSKDLELLSFAREPIFIPETRKLDDMIIQFQQEKLQIAVVLDEYGGLSGVVTIEDIVEQLFGEIYDEHETGDLYRIKMEKENTFYIKADTTMQEINDELELHLNRNDLSRTLAAFLIEHSGSIPTVGEVITFDFGTFTIVEMKGNRIESARLMLIEKEEN